MPTVLRRHQYELLDYNEQSLLVFGTDDTGYLTTARPLFESGEVVTNDQPYSLQDNFSMGRDYLSSGGVHLFEGQVLTDSVNGLGGSNPEAANEAYIEEIRSVWRDPRLRDRPTRFAILRKMAADGTVWRTYGRPRRCDPIEGLTTSAGATPITFDFHALEEGWYSDTLYTTTRKLYAAPEVGIVTPLVGPITTAAFTAKDESFVVTGKRDVWVTTTFYGPVTNPSAVISAGTESTTIALTGTVPAGQAVQVNSVPWARGIRRVHDGASMPHLMSRVTPRLSTLRISPGEKLLTYRGLDPTGSSYVRVSWRSRRNY